MKRYEITIFSDEELVDAIAVHRVNEVIEALNLFTVACESGRDDYNLSSYTVWLYDSQSHRNICFYTYDDDPEFGCYEELTSCQY